MTESSQWWKKGAGVLVLLAVLSSFATPSRAQGIAGRVFETKLSNGLKVILLEDHANHLITFQVWYRAGSRNEQWGKTGLSHVVEHMMFKGTPEHSADDFTRLVLENGGEYNAFTAEDFAGYFETMSSDKVDVSIELESDRMHNLVLRDQDFQTERMVVIEERRMRTDDNPQALLLEQVEATAYQTQPYHWPIIGWTEDLARITLDDLAAYYRTYYTPSNAFIVVVGDFKKEQLLPKIEAVFGKIPKTEVPTEYKYADPPQAGERRVNLEKEAQLPVVIVAHHAPNLTDPDGYVLEVIASILSSGKSSRLYTSLVWGKGLALEADAMYSLTSIDPALFYISAVPLPGKDTAEVEKAIDEELQKLRDEPVGDRELEKAKNQLESSFVFQQDSLFMQGMTLAQYEIAQSWRAIDDYIPSIRKVSAQDIQRVAAKYLVAKNRTTGILKALPITSGKPPAPVGSPLKGKTIENREE